ncbi:MAG TPA: hypothetical protein VEZ47_02200 [Gemmatirosa sp.]|nr:hypothetical protein [Gemmatirosa sp.]
MPASTIAAPAFRRARLRTVRTCAALATLSLAAACGDDPDVEDEPEIASVRLTVTPPGGAAQNYVLRTTGTNPTIALRVGTNAVSAVALDDDNQTISLGSDFELRIVRSVSVVGASEVETPLTGAVTFTRTGGLAGSLVATGAVTPAATAMLRIFHTGEGHGDFEPTINYTVTP